MEMGGGSGGNGGSAPSDSSPLNGLKFGKKIYFEDVGAGVSSKTSASGGGRGGRKGRGGSQAAGGGGVPRCQVEGCRLDLSDVKAYYSRHKVCSMHSKSPKVIVGGLEQRFCQQCSRFHLLAEFDQGKRSCRRRLAGHNERRRKPQPTSVFGSRYGQVLPTYQGSSSRHGGFLMDFTSFPRMPGRNAWPAITSGNWTGGNQPTPTGKLVPHQWHSSSGNPPPIVYSQASHPYLQRTAGYLGYSGSRVPSSEPLAGVADSSCALSLLSNQSWISRNQASSFEVNNIPSSERISMTQSTTSHSALMTSFTDGTWSLKEENDVNRSSHGMHSRFGLDQISQQPLTDHFSGELELAQQGGRQYMELGHPRDGSSSPETRWSL